MEWIHGIFIALVGLCLGSFASLLAYRWPRGLPWMVTRSKCPKCEHILGARDLIPVFSWIMYRGRCRSCAQPISIRYPVLESISALICVFLYALIGWHWLLMPALTLVPFGMAFVVMRLWPARD